MKNKTKIILTLSIIFLLVNLTFAQENCTDPQGNLQGGCTFNQSIGDQTPVQAQVSSQPAKSLQYEMVSYTADSKDVNTPFLNVAFFNKQFFTIDYASFSNGFQFIFDLIIGISIATAVVVFMLGAFEGIIGQNVTKEKIEAKDRMKNAIIGLMIILSTWLIINTVNPDLLRLPIFSGIDQLGKTTGSQSSGTQNVTAGSN